MPSSFRDVSAHVTLLVLLLGAALAADGAPRVGDLVAWGDGDRVEVRWTTDVPTKGRFELQVSKGPPRKVAEDPSCLRGSTNARRGKAGVGYANNHRATAYGVRAWPVTLRVVARTADGTEVASGTVNVVKPPAPRATLKPGVVTIGIDRGAWRDPTPPITVGVPMPGGALTDVDRLRLTHQGRPVPFQAEVVTRYLTDRTVKWLRLSFIAPRQAKDVKLEYGRPAPRVAAGLTVGRQGKRLLIDTGAARLSVEADGEGRFEGRSGALRLPRAVLVDKAGRSYVSRAERVALEEQGPVKVVVRLNGHHVAEDGARLFAFEERIHAYAGKPYVRLDYTFGNDRTKPEMTALRSLRLRFDGAGRGPVEVGAGERCALKTGQRVFQREDFEWVLEPGRAKGKRMEGVVRTGGARILVRDFWQEWPKSVARERDAVVLGLLPNLPAGFHAGRPDEHKLYFWIRDGLHTFRQGLAKTHVLYLDVSGRAAAESLIGDEPAGWSDPAWVERTGALGGLAVRTRDQFPDYDAALSEIANAFPRERDKLREYGLMNYGDWFGERKVNWGNLEYDLHHGLFTQFVRTGDARFSRFAADIARHHGDIDTRRWARDPREVGQQWLHCVGHTAGYYPYNWRKMKYYSSPGDSDNRGHVWNRGLLEHYLLGGDRRSWEAARLIADWVAGPQTTNFDFGNAREPGWMLVVALPTYAATEDPFYLNGARLMVRKVREKSAATGGHGFYCHRLGGGHCRCAKKHTGEAGFMLGTLMTGLRMYYEATGDRRAAEDIVRIARYVHERIWDPAKGAFHYTSCPKTYTTVSSAWMMGDGLAFAARHSRDPKLIGIALRAALAVTRRHAACGKSLGMDLCFAVQAMDGICRLPGPPFAERRKALLAEMSRASMRWLPTNVPNPDFETDAEGWWNRGYAVARCETVRHSGRASLRIEGKKAGANEYVFTAYDTGSSPAEIDWLAPGRKYRLTAWLRVDRLTPGTPAPSVRVQFRDAAGSRTAAYTNRYDLGRTGTWQKLTCDFTVPKWNKRNYLALCTHRRGGAPCGGLMYLDDVSVAPLPGATADTYEYVRLDPPAARRSGGMRCAAPRHGGGARLAGVGEAVFGFRTTRHGAYRVWFSGSAPKAGAGRLSVAGKSWPLPAGVGWRKLGSLTLRPGAHKATLKLTSPGPRVGRVLLTTDPANGDPGSGASRR